MTPLARPFPSEGAGETETSRCAQPIKCIPATATATGTCNALATVAPRSARTALLAIVEDPNAERADRIRAAEAILNRGLGKVAELPDEKKQAFAFFQPITPEQIALSQRM